MKADPSRFKAAMLAGAAATALLLTTADPATTAPPAKKTYFTVLLGLGNDYDWDATCLAFKAGTVCTSDRICGTWRRTADDEFTLDLSHEESGQTVVIEAKGRSELDGPNEAIGGTGVMRVGGNVFNFGFTGRSLKKKACKTMVRKWNVETTPSQPPQNGECLDRADFGKPERSDYILPFPAGNTYYLSQTYCYLYSTHRDEMAYDFDMPLGADIIAARAGEIIAVRDDLPDDNPWPDANYLKIQHEDGTVATYIHIKQDSVTAPVGGQVEQGQKVAEAAMSGTIDPHLHFVVWQGDPEVPGQDVPVNFSNADGFIDSLGGLIQDQEYTATPH